VEKVDPKKMAELNQKAAQLKKLLEEEEKELPDEVKRMLEREKAIKSLM
jgi:hypothetical protein